MANKKERVNVVYSTNPNFQYEYEEEEQIETLAPEKQNLRVTLDSKQRNGNSRRRWKCNWRGDVWF